MTHALSPTVKVSATTVIDSALPISNAVFDTQSIHRTRKNWLNNNQRSTPPNTMDLNSCKGHK